jgi:hypothetical protein
MPRLPCLATLLALVLPVSAAAAPINKAPAIVAQCAGQEAYATSSRPLPTARKAAALLPRTIGTLTREDVGAQVPLPTNEDFNVTYKAGKQQVFIGVALPGLPKDVQDAVRMTWQEVLGDRTIDRTGEKLCLGKDMSFYKLRKFYAWTRGDYFFYADASDQKTLDQFMAKFPY